LTLVAPSGSAPDGARHRESELVAVSSLPSGMRVVTESVPGVRSASVGVWIGVGSRNEALEQAGAAHYLEHLLFKGTGRRNAADIAQEIDAVGGELNAFTGKEHTCFYAHVLDADLPLAVDLLADVVTAATFAPEHVELERAVVLEEIAMRADDPEDLLGEVFDTALYGGHPLGRPVIGSEESVRMMTRARLRGFWRRHYVPSRMVVAAAGNVSHERVVELVEACFPPASDEPVAAASHGRAGPAEALTIPGGLVLHRDDTEQAHLMLGVPGLARRDPRRPALEVLNAALGGGLSSRLFQRIREERGLAYSVYSGVTCYTDTGQLTVYAGCQPSRLSDVVALARQVIAEVAADGLSEAEVIRAKGALRGGLVLGLEDTASRMQRIGRHELDLGHQRTVRQSLELIEAVTPERVASVAAEVLGQPFTAAVIGPYGSAADLPAALRGLAGQRG
jgi:predicted Zn-dependent peptidase